MSKPFDYSKWDKIELSDDEEDVHPNIDKESWFRMKHRSRVEREENEEKEKKKIDAEMKIANQRIKVLEHDLIKMDQLVIEEVNGGNKKNNDDDDDDDDDDDLDDREGIQAELKELRAANAARQARLDEIEKNKKWNVDNMCHVVEERTIVNKNAATTNYTETGYAKPKDEDGTVIVEAPPPPTAAVKTTSNVKEVKAKPIAAAAAAAAPVAAAAKPAAAATTVVAPAGPTPVPQERVASDAMETYHEFTVKYADIVEEFMHITSLERSKEFLLKHGDVLLQENASNYLLLASLEDEMNGYRDKMKLTARQSQICSNIAELAKSMQTHPGNVVIPFFSKMEHKTFFEGFMDGVEAFVQKIIARAITKKAEMDRAAASDPTDLQDIPKEERLGPGGLDPLEVIDTLPQSMQDAFASRDIEQLKQALMDMPPEEAAHHMKRCVDSGLWVDQA